MSQPITLEPKWFSDHEIKLVRGAYAAMARVGTQQLSLRGMAKELGVSPPLLVYHFGSKDNLLIETMHWALAGTVRRIQRRIDGIEDPQEALAALIDEVFVDAQANRDFHLVYMDLVQYAVRHESFGKLTALLQLHINGSYASVIQQGVDRGLFEVDDVELAAWQVRAIVEGGFLQWIQEDDWRGTHAALQRDCYAAILRLIGPRQPAKGRARRAPATPARAPKARPKPRAPRASA